MTCKRHMIIWCADGNGQLEGEKEEEKAKSPNGNKTHNKIEPYARENRKRKWDTTCKNMSNATDDTDDNMESTKKETQATWKTQTP